MDEWSDEKGTKCKLERKASTTDQIRRKYIFRWLDHTLTQQSIKSCLNSNLNGIRAFCICERNFFK